MERYSAKKPQWFSHFFCARPCLHMLENQGNRTEMCVPFPKERPLLPAGRTWEGQVKHLGVSESKCCGALSWVSVCPPQSTQTMLTCTAWTSPLVHKNYKLRIFLLFLPFCLSFYLKTCQTDVTELLCLQSVSIPNKGAVSDYLNSAARQWPVLSSTAPFGKALNRSLKIVNFVTFLPYYSPIPEIWCAKATC